ncbi:MAG: hypothetical protein M1821_002011 [Bathelium mastoideum]|nr:MAG: hypothetical protein M1821_002011 [Bathelium mastoideum]KAI9692517.1 MAG: hypothetical protein M1822_006748 [Bathelium mastoideum]
MSTKKTGAELLAELDTIGGDDAPPASTATSKPSQPATSSSESPSTKEEDDPLAQLTALAIQRPTSRPATPRRKEVVNTPSSSTASGRTSEEKSRLPPAAGGRRSGEGAAFQQKFTPRVEDADEDLRHEQSREQEKEVEREREEKAAGGGGGGWWGGIFGAASAAMKTGEAFVKDLSKNEEAQKWAERVQGNALSLRDLGADLRTRALPTFTSLLHTLAPPISAHERLVIHSTHDLVAYPSLNPTIHAAFARVMAQVEGGDLLVLQHSSSVPSSTDDPTSPLRPRSSDDDHQPNFGVGGGASSWTASPWWRESATHRSLGTVHGLREGTKLCRVAAEQCATDFFSARGGLEAAAARATAELEAPTGGRSSDIFLALQPIVHEPEKELFAASGAGRKEGTEGESKAGEQEGGGVEPEDNEEDDDSETLLSFAIYLQDPIHRIAFATLSQPVPHKWLEWLNAHDPTSASSDDLHTEEKTAQGEESKQLPREIRAIISSGGVDPREWVAEWVEEVLGLGVGLVAQRYVARRMGVGEGAMARGKTREEIVESGAGEAARAM